MEKYRRSFIEYLQEKTLPTHPQNLYQPIHYILQLGGKRIRPILTLMASDIFCGDYTRGLNAALAIEVFHNFSLVHDDIMDKAPLRRGKQTVHTKWDLNTAILSGDAMLIIAYQLFENYSPLIFKELAELFSKTALKVCEGQQYDIDFETRSDVTTSEYMKMIEYKTAVLIGAALQMGAIAAEASEENKELIYDFGLQLGIAFQLQDDYLDTFGDDTFGKKIGGDILENKKTILYLQTLEKASEEDKKQLLKWYENTEGINEQEKISSVSDIFRKNKIKEFVRSEIQKYTEKAFRNLQKLQIPEDKREILHKIGVDLMSRTV